MTGQPYEVGYCGPLPKDPLTEALEDTQQIFDELADGWTHPGKGEGTDEPR